MSHQKDNECEELLKMVVNYHFNMEESTTTKKERVKRCMVFIEEHTDRILKEQEDKDAD